MEPHPNFTLNVHMDGLEETTTGYWNGRYLQDRHGGHRQGQGARFPVCTNTTIFKETDLIEIEMLFSS